jgi:hypothetical protein
MGAGPRRPEKADADLASRLVVVVCCLTGATQLTTRTRMPARRRTEQQRRRRLMRVGGQEKGADFGLTSSKPVAASDCARKRSPSCLEPV